MPRCPVCSEPVEVETAATAPFCSARCRMVDLGRWLGESYGLPRPAASAADDDEDGLDGGDES